MNKRPQAQLSSKDALHPDDHKSSERKRAWSSTPCDTGSQRRTRQTQPAVTRQATVNSEPRPQEPQPPRRSNRRSSQPVLVVNAKLPKRICEAKGAAADQESKQIKAADKASLSGENSRSTRSASKRPAAGVQAVEPAPKRSSRGSSKLTAPAVVAKRRTEPKKAATDVIPTKPMPSLTKLQAKTRLKGTTKLCNSLGLRAADVKGRERAPRNRSQANAAGPEPSEVETPASLTSQKPQAPRVRRPQSLTVSEYMKLRRPRLQKNENSPPKKGSDVQAVEQPDVPPPKLPIASPSELGKSRNGPKENITTEEIGASPATTATPPISAIPVSQPPHSYNTRSQSHRRSLAEAVSSLDANDVGHAMIVHTSERESSCQLALATNLLSLNDEDYFCYETEDEQLLPPQGEKSGAAGYDDQMPIGSSPPIRVTPLSSGPKPIPSPTAHAPAVAVIEPPAASKYANLLLGGLGEKCEFKRHSYTNFQAYKKRPGQYETVPLDSKVGLTAVAYAALREKPQLISFFYS